METKLELVAGVDRFTLLELFRRAAAHKGLTLHEGADTAYSEPIKQYKLNPKLLTALAERKIRRQQHPDCENEIFTLVDENQQKKVDGYAPSNYWNFKLVKGGDGKFDLQIALCVGFTLNIERRGIVFCTLAHGTFLSASDRLPNFRMFKALTENDKNAPAVAKELAESDNGSIVVSWTDLGLGGIRSLAGLFVEFARNNNALNRLGLRGEVFDPQPHPQFQPPGDKMFVVEPAQPKLFDTWRAQLNDYRSGLTVT